MCLYNPLWVFANAIALKVAILKVPKKSQKQVEKSPSDDKDR
jgi:hypothetical protein